MANTTNNKRYYWLKLDRNFFKDARIKKLRRIAGGDTFTIIYLKLMLLSIEYGGTLVYEEIEPTIADELALKIDEDNDNVSVTVKYLLEQGLMIEIDDNYELPQARNSIGSETYNNVHKRNKRLEKFQSNSNQIPIDIDKDIEIEKENILLPHTCVREEEELSIPTLDEVIKFCKENNFKINPNDFYNYNNSFNWKINGQPIKNWKALLRTCEFNPRNSNTSSSSSYGNRFVYSDPDWLETYVKNFEASVECL